MNAMQPILKATLTFVLLIGVLIAPARAQDQVEWHAQPESELWIDGTSNKSDWTVHATEFQAAVTLAPDATPPEIEAATVTVPSAKLRSQKSTIMDRLMHGALKVDEHPEIQYELTSAESTASSSSNPATFTVETHGNLTLAGVTKDIVMTVQGDRLDDGTIHFTGSHELLMTDYNMKPPTAMFGALRTADQVTISFDLIAGPEEATQ